jgi:hypothetical protein
MSQIPKSQSKDFSKEIPNNLEEKVVFYEKPETLERKISNNSLEDAASLAIADAIDNLPRMPDDLVLSSKRTLEAAENISLVEFQNRSQGLEEILGTIKQWSRETPDDIQAFYKLVYTAAQKLRQNGDYYSLDALHDGAIEIAKSGKKIRN